MSRSRVYQWCTWFGEGRTSLGDEPKSCRPKTSTNEENTTRVIELIRCDRRMKIREIALKLEIPKMQRSAAKVMATVFWDTKGVILLDILCINAARYCSTLDRLKEAIRRKRHGGVVLQHDNATPHSANLTQQRYGWEILPHPAQSRPGTL
ncbi:histone-lysine N-methyltransferase SETMAR [Plakobranchus ocellatus]|uniref:Histone-lysine N-methyltransferase SETMAR n=1 Tax=Plakobranchus ocellatus TaxID=259542 RepID=A0AAV4BQS7_9GAST|nr:histone-lysine N-methyltransferase SETMAR [Plakobranchus ocellatus]